MHQILLFAGLVICLSSCGKDNAQGTSSNTSTSSGVNVATVLDSVLPAPGASSAKKSRNTRVAAWTQNAGSASESKMAFQLFRVFADPSVYDPDSSVWGVQNVRNSISLGGFVSEKAQTLLTGSQNVTLGTNSFPVQLTAITAIGAAVPYPVPSYPNTHFSDDPGAIFDYGRNITLDGTFSVDVAWGTSGGIFSLKTAEHDPGHETSFMEGQYNEGTGDLRLNRACKANNVFHARLNVSGNNKTDTFTVKFSNYSTGGTFLSVVAKGSSASGDHYIVKMKYNSSAATSAGSALRYFCVDADATENEFTALYNDNVANNHADYTGAGVQMVADPTNFTGACSGSAFIAQVNAMTMYTESDIPTTANLWDATAGNLF